MSETLSNPLEIEEQKAVSICDIKKWCSNNTVLIGAAIKSSCAKDPKWKPHNSPMPDNIKMNNFIIMFMNELLIRRQQIQDLEMLRATFSNLPDREIDLRMGLILEYKPEYYE